MYQLVLLIHVFAAVCIIALVLVQQGKGASVGAAFGSGASQTVFGSRGSGSFLFRLTMGLAVLFFTTSLSMNYMTTHAYKQQKNVNLSMPALPAKPAKPELPTEINASVPAIPATSAATTPSAPPVTNTANTPVSPATLPVKKN